MARWRWPAATRLWLAMRVALTLHSGCSARARNVQTFSSSMSHTLPDTPILRCGADAATLSSGAPRSSRARRTFEWSLFIAGDRHQRLARLRNRCRHLFREALLDHDSRVQRVWRLIWEARAACQSHARAGYRAACRDTKLGAYTASATLPLLPDVPLRT